MKKRNEKEQLKRDFIRQVEENTIKANNPLAVLNS